MIQQKYLLEYFVFFIIYAQSILKLNECIIECLFIKKLSTCTVLRRKKFDNKIAQLFCLRNLLWALWLNKWYCTYTNTYKVYLQSTVFFLYFPITVKWLNLLLTLKREFAINCHNLLNGNSRIFFFLDNFLLKLLYIRSF